MYISSNDLYSLYYQTFINQASLISESLRLENDGQVENKMYTHLTSNMLTACHVSRIHYCTYCIFNSKMLVYLKTIFIYFF